MKKIKYLVLLLAFSFIATGCVKYNTKMDIKKDKSMDFSIIYALNKTYFNNQDSISDKNRKELKDRGFKVEKYSKDSMDGFKVTKHFKNIDEISDPKNVKYDLSGVTEGKEKSDKIFKVKKGLFANHYTAKFNFNLNDSSLSDNSTDMSSYLSSMDLSFDVNLPYAAKKNNATKVNKDKTKLSWDLTSSKVKDIKFEFELYNTTNIIIAVVIFIVIVGVATFCIIRSCLKKDKTPKEEKKTDKK